jgi:hypothetical protein
MTEERFSLRYGYEQKPEHPIFEEAPKRLQFYLMKSYQTNFEVHRSMRIIAEAACRPELMFQITTPGALWGVLFPQLEEWYGWEIYNLIEPLYVELKNAGQYAAPTAFEDGLNQLFGEENIGWRLKDGRLERTLPVAAREQVDAVFKEPGNPRFAPARTHVIAAYKAYNARPQRGLDVCSNAFDACESVAKEVLNLPTATFGGVLAEARNNKTFATETINTLEKLYALSNNHFRHGMTQSFALGSSELDFIYLTCLAAILLFVRLP